MSELEHLTLDDALATPYMDASIIIQGVSLEVRVWGDGFQVRWSQQQENDVWDFTHAESTPFPDLATTKRFIGERWPDALDSHEWFVCVWMA